MRISLPFLPVFALTVAALGASPAQAWEDHTLYTRPALAMLPEVASFPAVQAETIESYLQAEQEALVALLAAEEQWAVEHVPVYKPRPEALAFVAGGEPAELRDRFLRALRVNPTIKLALYQKLPPGQEATGATLSWQDLTTLSTGGPLAEAVLLPLLPGEPVSALEVLAAATDEPDYGLDLGVWEDNDSAWSASYGFGLQPFGNPKLEFGAQAPFHMGLYHEAGIIYKLASFLQQTYPEYRIHLYQSLAHQAFTSGHDYWGWRFLGWALHYTEDLSQPYHARILPGVSVCRMLWVNTLSMVGISGPKDNAVQLVSNRHLSLEVYVHDLLMEEEEGRATGKPLLASLADTATDGSYGPFDDAYLRDVLTVESVARADDVDHQLAKTFPKRLVSDPEYLFGETEPDLDVLAAVRADSGPGKEALDTLLEDLMRSVGAHARNFVRAARQGLPMPAPPPEPVLDPTSDPTLQEPATAPDTTAPKDG